MTTIQTEYHDKPDVDRILGEEGLKVAAMVAVTIKNKAAREHWPLTSITIRNYRDQEYDDWEYVIIAGVFNATFKQANGYLPEIYKAVDDMAHFFLPGQSDIFIKSISVGIEIEDEPS